MLKLLVSFVLFLSLVSCNQFGNQKLVPEGWKSHSEKDYSINYPETWELNTSGQIGTRFVLFSQPTSEEDQFRENINLLIQDLEDLDMDLDKYVEISKQQVAKLITDGVVVESERLTSEQGEYHRIVYTGMQGVFKLKFTQYYFIIGQKAYILTFTCEQSQFENFESIGKEIMNSFNISTLKYGLF